MTTSPVTPDLNTTAVTPTPSKERQGGIVERLKARHAELMAQNRTYALLAEIVLAIKEHDPSLLAKQAAYSLLYAVPSILVMMVSLAAIVDKNTGAEISGSLQNAIQEQAPANLRPLLESLVQYALVETSENTAVVAVIVSLAVAVWSATGGVGALMYAINAVYDIKDRRPFIKAAAIKVGLMLLGGILVIVALFLLAFGRRLLEWLPNIAVVDGVLNTILSSSPLWAMILLVASLLLLYWFGLDTPKSVRWIVPGAVIATLAIGLIVGLLDLILTYSNPGAAYGVAGSVLILLWTFFILSAIVVVGAIINSVLGKHFDRKLIAGLQSRPPEMPGNKRIAVSVYR
jgi:membrane protein